MRVSLSSTGPSTDALAKIFQLGVAGFTVEKLFTAVVAAVVCLVVIKILLKLVDRTLRRIHLDGTLKKLIRGGLKGLLLFLELSWCWDVWTFQ